MAGFEERFHPGNTIFSEDVVSLLLESPFLVILVHSSCFSNATVSANLGGFAFLQLLITLSGTSAAEPDSCVWTAF